MSFTAPLRRAAPRAAFQSSFAVRRPHVRFQSSSSAPSSSSSHVLTGLASGGAVALVAYGLYTFTPAGRIQSRINSAAYTADKQYKEVTKKFNESKPDANQAIEWLKSTAYSYAAFIPGGRGYVDTAFKDLDTIREKHGEDVDKILNETYTELQKATKSGLSTQTLQKVLEALQNMSKKVGAVAADGFSDLLDNHPQLKEKFGSNLDQLKSMGEQYGPDAKKQVDQTWQQVKEVMEGGLSVATFDKARKLIQDKTEEVKKLGEKAWSEGLEQAKPLLEKNPKVKSLIEDNADALKSGNMMELLKKLKDSVSSGKIEDLQSYIDSAVGKAKKTVGGGGLEQYLNMIPGGSEILPKLGKLKNLTEIKTEEAEKLLKETMEQLQGVVSKQSKKAEELLEKKDK